MHLVHSSPTMSPFGSKLHQIDGDFTPGFSVYSSITCSWHSLSPRRSERALTLLFHHHPHCDHLLCRISNPMGALDLQQSQSDFAETCQRISSFRQYKKLHGREVGGGSPYWMILQKPAWIAQSPLPHQLGALSENDSCITAALFACGRSVLWGGRGRELQNVQDYPRTFFQAMD